MLKKITIEAIVSKSDAVIALRFRGKNTSRSERLAIIHCAAKFVPLMAKEAMNKDKKAGLI